MNKEKLDLLHAALEHRDATSHMPVWLAVVFAAALIGAAIGTIIITNKKQ